MPSFMRSRNGAKNGATEVEKKGMTDGRLNATINATTVETDGSKDAKPRGNGLSLYSAAFKKQKNHGTPDDYSSLIENQNPRSIGHLADPWGKGESESQTTIELDISAQAQVRVNRIVEQNVEVPIAIHVRDENNEPVPSYRIVEHVQIPSSFDDIGQDSTSQNVLLEVKETLLVDDDYSDAELSFRGNKSDRSVPTWLSKNRGRDGNESDSSNDGLGDLDPDDEAYDSDLVTEPDDEGRAPRLHAKNMRKWKAQASTRFENMLLECIVNTDHIPSRYSNVYVDKEVIKELERVTRLSLDRKLAFSFGVLKGNRVTGAVLWGPPGTGKTLLAKALAKESGCNMISVTTAELWQKCHGDDEKVIKALFSMGRKMYPCIIFLDEADAMLGSRKAGEKRHIRAMFNQFLMEWDGLMSGQHSPFMLLATNRPFDLDPAVLRRAPVQIHLDVPSAEARLKILELLLEDETLEPGLSRTEIAQKTRKYTGSDLKNLCVTAATICVDEQAEAGIKDSTQRVLRRSHFARAMKSIKPTQLNAVMRNDFHKFAKNRDTSVVADEEN